MADAEQVALEVESGGEGKGPSADRSTRKCTDILCLVAFLVFW